MIAAPEHHATSVERKSNNFGLLRLLLASLVVVSHGPEIIDGNRSREILSRIFGTASFGVLAVDGFFLISGFLITKSWVGEPKLGAFFGKRILRIYPGYVVATLLCVFVVGPVAAEHYVSFGSMYHPAMRSLAMLYGPMYPVPHAFKHQVALNAPMWTIRWEFKCYVLAGVLGLIGLTRQKWPWLLLSATTLACMVYNDRVNIEEMSTNFVCISRFVSLFSTGAVFFLYRDKIVYDPRLSFIALLGLVLCLSFSCSAQFGIAVFGGYLLFALAFTKLPIVDQVGRSVDVSYGLYLYAWPIQQLLFLYFPQVPLPGQILATLVLSCFMGYLSWQLVEKHALKMKTLFSADFGHRPFDSLRSKLAARTRS